MIDPNLSTDAFKVAVEARLLALAANADPRLAKVRAAGEQAAVVAHVETVILLKQMHAEGRIAWAAKQGVVIDDDFLTECVVKRLDRVGSSPLNGLAAEARKLAKP